jgi:hypothetical protein
VASVKKKKADSQASVCLYNCLTWQGNYPSIYFVMHSYLLDVNGWIVNWTTRETGVRNNGYENDERSVLNRTVELLRIVVKTSCKNSKFFPCLITLLKPSCPLCIACFNALKLCILPIQCIYALRVVLTINNDCFPNSINRLVFVAVT